MMIDENGKNILYDKNNQKKGEGYFDNGKQHGEWIFYNVLDGSPIKTVKNYKNGVLEGEIYEYYDIDKKPKIVEGRCSNGKRDGMWYFYGLKTGKVHKSLEYKDGELNGRGVYYNVVTGIKVSEGEYENGKREGEWRFYTYSKGKLHAIELYKDGLMEGAASYYDTTTGCTELECGKEADGQYIKNLRSGVWTFYNSKTGKLKSTETYADSLLNGEAFYYDESTGTLESHIYYKNGLMHGYCTQYYTATGNMRTEGNFIAGKGEGVVKIYFNDTQKHVREIWNLKNDEFDGPLTRYDSASQNVLEICNYKMGLLNGQTIKYFADKRGLIKSNFNFVNGQLNGSYTIYDSVCGTKIEEGNIVDNNQEGLVTAYYKCSNQIYCVVDYKNDVYQGHGTYYDSASGLKLSEGDYNVGSRTGEWKYYYAGSSALKSTSVYKNDMYNGITCLYDSLTGKLVSKGKYKKGNRVGEWDLYNVHTGKKVYEENYSDGELDGLQVIYDSVGNVILKVNFTKGKIDGKMEYFYEGLKQAWMLFNFSNGKLHGVTKSYFRTGNRKREELYKDGVLVSSKCYAANGDTTAYYPIKIEAEFDGDVMTYIGNNISYPKEAQEQKKEGKVVVRFVVNETGMVKDAEIIKSAGYGMDEEALRIVSQMPPWQPFYLDGIPYKSLKTLPIVFWLQH